MVMEVVEDIVIVGAGIAGLTTSLGLTATARFCSFNDPRLGIRSFVLESADTLRTYGFAFALWSNAWKALDALGIGDILRQQHNKLTRLVIMSVVSVLPTAELPFESHHEVRRINRKVLIETLQNELPEGTIRFAFKVVHVHDFGLVKIVHLTDGTTLKIKKYLGFGKPAVTTRASIRGNIEFKGGHEFLQFYGNGVRFGVTPCDDHGVYWFFTYIPSSQDEGVEKDPAEMKQFVLSKLGNVSSRIKAVFEQNLNNMIWSQLKSRRPWELLWGNISKDTVCVAGDALHPMMPGIGQGGCSALEDGIVLARVLNEAMTRSSIGTTPENDAELEHRRVIAGLEKFAKERRWRGIKLVAAAYVVGYVSRLMGL